MSEPPAAERAVFDRVTKRFGRRLVFDNISFDLRRGGRYGLLGPNGAGKSTLVRLLSGVLRPDEGQVLVNGRSPWRDPARARADMGLLPEGAPLVSELTVREHLRLAGAFRGLAPAVFHQEEERLVTALSLTPFYQRPAGILSQGQKRRAALASALLGRPDFLVLDEPTSGLDPEESLRLLALLKDLPTEVTLLVSSHILSEIFEITAEVLVLARGALVARGPWRRAAGETPNEADLRREYLDLTAGEA
ncbi:MAG: ABC transporter ATP-binding protein [Candidatus Adiutrix sp.]|jgi:ABC-2 type transport system ATP-binding protein|nr:ABC transporter ATP-binding protein [Candidatus Adiutrix sp.]